MNTRSRRHTQPSIHGPQARPGFALFMALGALVIIGVLVAGSSFIALQETRLGQNSLVQTRAFSVAEYGLNKIQADWDKTPNLQMANGASFDTSYASLDLKDTSHVRYTRLNNETFWIVSEGRSVVGSSLAGGSRTAVKRVGAVLRLRIPTIEAKGAITAGGNVSIKGNAGVDGRDSVPASWGCTNTPQDLPGVVVPPGSTVTTQGSGTVDGTPPTATDAQAGQAETYFGFGEENWASLISQANVNLGALTSPPDTPHPTLDAGGYCDKTNRSNWGEPIRPDNFEASMGTLVPPCYNYFPIIYAPNGLSLSGHGRGQGIVWGHGRDQRHRSRKRQRQNHGRGHGAERDRRGCIGHFGYDLVQLLLLRRGAGAPRLGAGRSGEGAGLDGALLRPRSRSRIE
jgi:hypothetical protein